MSVERILPYTMLEAKNNLLQNRIRRKSDTYKDISHYRRTRTLHSKTCSVFEIYVHCQFMYFSSKSFIKFDILNIFLLANFQVLLVVLALFCITLYRLTATYWLREAVSAREVLRSSRDVELFVSFSTSTITVIFILVFQTASKIWKAFLNFLRLSLFSVLCKDC